jgi:hypothetical protein
VKAACGAVSGEALCFDGEPTRSVVMSEMDTSQGGSVHFSLRTLPEGAPASVVLEHKTLGAPWKTLSTVAADAVERAATAEAPGGFVRHSVGIPLEAQSLSTRLRWRQLPLKGAACVPCVSLSLLYPSPSRAAR